MWHLLLPLMNSFNKTKAAIFPDVNCAFWGLLFSQIFIFDNSWNKIIICASELYDVWSVSKSEILGPLVEMTSLREIESKETYQIHCFNAKTDKSHSLPKFFENDINISYLCIMLGWHSHTWFYWWCNNILYSSEMFVKLTTFMTFYLFVFTLQ